MSLLLQDTKHNIKFVSPECVSSDCKAAVCKTDKSNHRSGDEHVSVEAKPGKVQSEPDSKVLFDLVNGLVHNPFVYLCPLGVQEVPQRARHLVVPLSRAIVIVFKPVISDLMQQ